ncbi:MAG: hypothetical protein M5U28_17375 [Sandaracinaceae bacterium]|nr:hypothetical protein [Sandaracinaceae bacterium]
MRATASWIVTLPSGVTEQLAPGGTPPDSPMAARARVSAVIQLPASTRASESGAEPPSSVTTSLQLFFDNVVLRPRCPGGAR